MIKKKKKASVHDEYIEVHYLREKMKLTIHLINVSHRLETIKFSRAQRTEICNKQWVSASYTER